MKAHRLLAIILVALLAGTVCTGHAGDATFPASPMIQVVRVAGTEITGLNSFSLTQEIEAATASGATAVMIDMTRVERMTPAGLAPFQRAVDQLGNDHVGLVGVSGQPRDVLLGSGKSYRLFDTVEEATAAVK